MPQKSSGFGLASGVDVTRQLPEEEAKELRTALLQEVAYPIRSAGFDAQQLRLVLRDINMEMSRDIHI